MPIPDDADLRAQGDPDKYTVYAKVRAPNGSILEVLVEMGQEEGRKLFLTLSAESLMHSKPLDVSQPIHATAPLPDKDAVPVMNSSGGELTLAADPEQDFVIGNVVGVGPDGKVVRVRM